MKATGIIRRVDDLGRIVIPREIRKNLGIKEGDPLEVSVDEKGVYFQKIDMVTDFIDEMSEIINSYEDDISGEITALLLKARGLAIEKKRKEMEEGE